MLSTFKDIVVKESGLVVSNKLSYGNIMTHCGNEEHSYCMIYKLDNMSYVVAENYISPTDDREAILGVLKSLNASKTII